MLHCWLSSIWDSPGGFLSIDRIEYPGELNRHERADSLDHCSHLLGILLLFITNQRVLSVLGGSIAVVLALIAQFVPIELAMKLGPLSLKINSSLTILGRVLSIQPTEGSLLALIYGAAALWFFGAEASQDSHTDCAHWAS